MEIRFDGERALITGGGRGIGREIALLLHGLGAKVVVMDRNREDMASLNKDIGCETIEVELTDPADAAKAAKKALPVDLLVNCAGVVTLQPFLETTVDNFDETMNVNVRAMMIVSQVVAGSMGPVCRAVRVRPYGAFGTVSGGSGELNSAI